MARRVETVEHEWMMAEHSRGFPPGVRSIDHAADVGLRIDAPDLPALLDRAARGMIALLAGDEAAGDEAAADEGAADEAASSDSQPAKEARAPVPATGDATARRQERPEPERRRITIDAVDPPQLLADWLRELLYLHEVHGLDYAGACFTELTETRLRADVELERASPSPIREIKGVTYHGLEAARTPGGTTGHPPARQTDGGWYATVIFDV